MRLITLRKKVLALTLLLMAGGLGYWLGQREVSLAWKNNSPQVRVVNKLKPKEREEVNFALFWQVWERLENEYLDSTKIDEAEMVYGAIRGMTAALGDPYTAFLSPEDNQDSKEDLAGQFEGVGIQLGFREGVLAVVAPLKGTPAEKAGVQAGDLITKIDERDTQGISLPESVELIRGEKGTQVTLGLVREGEYLEIEIIRGTIKVKSVELEWKDEVAYVRLSRFGDETKKEWDEVVGEIVRHQPGVEKMVLDLRNNPGGYVDGAVYLASEFLEEGDLVVTQQEKWSKSDLRTKRVGKLQGIKMVILLNQGSASSSEILAGALKDQGQAVLVGEKSFGKGTVQEVIDFRGGSGLHVTTARWLLPSGKWIHENGIEVDHEVEFDRVKWQDEGADNQLEKALEVVAF
jgi:carboxyl-terminal processing protease